MTFARLFCSRTLLCFTCIAIVNVMGISASQIATAAPTNPPKLQEGGKAKKQIEQLKKLKLIEVLNLDDATAEKFFVRYNAEQKKVDDARKSFEDAMKELDKANNSGNSDKVKQLTQQTLDKNTQLQNTTNGMLRSIREILNEKQYADYLVFEANFQKQLDELLRTKRDARRDSLKK
jgi:hypothetical protein